MRSNGLPPRGDASNPPLGPPPTPRGTALLVLIMLGLPVAASYPAPSAGLIAGTIAVRFGGRPLVRWLRNQRIDRKLGPVCVPRTDVCLGA